VGGGVSKKCGITGLPLVTSEGAGDSVVALVVGGAGVGGAAVVAGAAAAAPSVAAGAGVVALGVGAGSAHAGAMVTAGSDAREMTSVATSAAALRIEFTFRPS
jgi:hypothetical protein